MKVYVNSPEKMFMFWGHDGDLWFTTSVIKRDMGDVKTHFWNLGRPYKGLLCIHKYRSRYRKKLVPEKEPFPVPENVLWCTFFEKVHIWNTLLDGQSSRQSNDPQFLKHIRVGELWLKRATESSGCCGCGGSWITEPFYQQPHSQSLATKQPGTSKVTASSLPNWLQIWGSNKQRVSTFVSIALAMLF